MQCSVDESAKKRGWCANIGILSSVGGMPSWLRGSNFFGVGRIFFVPFWQHLIGQFLIPCWLETFS